MSTTQSKYGRRFDEEFKREVAALASRAGAKQEQVARDLGRESLQRVTLEEALRRLARRAFFWSERPGIGTTHQGAGA